jgi:hypothetical protein
VTIDPRLEAARERFDARADALFESAWAGVQTLAQPFKFELDFLREPSGRWRDFMRHAACPALDLPLCLLHDLGAALGDSETVLEDGLLDVAALSTAAVLASELVQGGEAHFNQEHGLLGQGLVLQAQWRLADIAPEREAAAAWARAHWQEHGSAMLDHRTRRLHRSEPYTPLELATLGRRWSPLKTPMFVAADRAGRRDIVLRLEGMLDEALSLHQLGRELGQLHRDLSRGHCSYPVWRLTQSLGGAPDPRRSPDPDRTLLAALLTPTLRDLAGQALGRVEVLRAALTRAGLAAVARALASLAGPFDRLFAVYEEASRPETASSVSFSLSHRPQREQVLSAGRAYLRGDPAATECWEVYRWAYLNERELVCRVFPIGFLLEHRIEAGDDCGAEVDALLDLYARNRYHYFDTMSVQPPDFDTLGLMMRLAPHAADPRRAAELLEVPLRWLLANVDEDGDIPVFMTAGFDAVSPGPYVHVIGRRCTAVQAGVLLGLLALDSGRHQGLIARAARRTLEVFAHRGSGSLRCYDLPYGAGLVLALCDGLRRVGGDLVPLPAVQRAEERAVTLLGGWRALGRIAPQDAALLELASQWPAAAALRDPAWAEMLIRSQHNDGSWDASPLYVIPCRGNLMNWHVSRLLTSALACHALAGSPHVPSTPTGEPTHGCST